MRLSSSHQFFNGSQEKIEFERGFMNRLGNEAVIVARWERASPEGETFYVSEGPFSTNEITLNRSLAAYTPTEPGEYEFSLLISTSLNPVGPEYNEADGFVLTTGTNVFVYSEEQAASFTISEASYRLEQLAIIGLILALMQLVRSTWPSRNEN